MAMQLTIHDGFTLLFFLVFSRLFGKRRKTGAKLT
jgi:hypothetical protein